MMTLSNNADHMEKRQKSARKRICSQFLALVGLGTMVLAVGSLLPGCGSESTPGGAVKGKSAKTASTPAPKNSSASTLLLMGEKGASQTGEVADTKKQPDRKSILMNGITLEEMERRNAAAAKTAQSPGVEVMPGVTREEMERRKAAAAKTAQSPGFEIMPGVTREEMQRRNAEAVKMSRSPGFEVMQGKTREEMQQKRNTAVANAPGKPPVIQGKSEIAPPVGGK